MTVHCVIQDGTIHVRMTECGVLVYDMVLKGTADYIEIMKIHERLRDMDYSYAEVSQN